MAFSCYDRKRACGGQAKEGPGAVEGQCRSSPKEGQTIGDHNLGARWRDRRSTGGDTWSSLASLMCHDYSLSLTSPTILLFSWPDLRLWSLVPFPIYQLMYAFEQTTCALLTHSILDHHNQVECGGFVTSFSNSLWHGWPYTGGLHYIMKHQIAFRPGHWSNIEPLGAKIRPWHH